MLAAAHQQRQPRWINVNGTRLPGSFAREGDIREIAIADLSCFTKIGLKGPRAAGWLADSGLMVPSRPNSWAPLPTGGLIARLAESEFFIEDDSADHIAPLLENAPQQVYAVPRHDTAISLAGKRVNDVLLQTCSVDFASITAQGVLLITSMIGVPVLVVPQNRNRLPLVRIWVDPTFGPYLWHSLLEIVEELGGGPAGLITLFPEMNVDRGPA